MADKPSDAQRAAALQAQLKALQTQMTRLGGAEAKKAAQILSEVAKLASHVAASGKDAVDPETTKRDLRNQSKKVQDLIKRLGNKPT